MTPAERMQAMRDRKAERGETRRHVELTPEAATKAERIAAARGISPTAAVNAIVTEAPDP